MSRITLRAAIACVAALSAMVAGPVAAQQFPTKILRVVNPNQPGGNSGASQTGTSFLRNRFVLIGDAEGDFGVTLSMISNTCQPASNYLLARPSTVPHPSGATTQATAVLPAGSGPYNTLFNWIQSGCTP